MVTLERKTTDEWLQEVDEKLKRVQEELVTFKLGKAASKMLKERAADIMSEAPLFVNDE